jgi:hypothetical protein
MVVVVLSERVSVWLSTLHLKTTTIGRLNQLDVMRFVLGMMLRSMLHINQHSIHNYIALTTITVLSTKSANT